MKKTIALILSVLLLFSFAACSKSEKPSDNTDNPPTTDETTPADVSESDTFARGSWNADGTEFINTSTGIRIRIPKSFTVQTDEQLAETYLGGNDSFVNWTEKDFETEISIPDCQFIHNTRYSNTGIMYENLAAENATAATEKMYLDVVTTQLKNGNYTNLETGEYYELTLCGKTYLCADITYVSGGNDVIQTMAVRKVCNGNYICIIVFTSFNEVNHNPDMISMFY